METATDLEALVQELREELRQVSARLARLEGERAPLPDGQAIRRGSVPAAPAAESAAPAAEEITEEELTAISAAVAAYLGVRAHIRQVRLVSSSRWAQEGRVSVQASHRLH